MIRGFIVSQILTPDWRLFIEQYPQFQALQRALAKEDWFVRDGWVMYIGHYHAGIYAQVFKPHWFNQTGDGIHLEFGLDQNSLDIKSVTLDLHVGHRNLFDRQRFNELTIHQMETATKTLGLAKFSKTNLSARLSLAVKFTKTGFSKQITNALTQLSVLGPIIDDGLKQLS
jgi:hypothetical protein